MMTLRRVILSSVLLLWCMGLWGVSLPIRDEVSHTYHHRLADFGGSLTDLPALTARVSLPILGDELHVDAARSPLFYLYWGLLWLGPAALGMAVWTVRDSQRLMEVWVYASSFYAAFVLCSAVFILAGLWLPFALL